MLSEVKNCRIEVSHAEQLFSEFSEAIKKTTREEMAAWCLYTGGIFCVSGTRRVKNLIGFGISVASKIDNRAVSLIKDLQDGRGVENLKGIGKDVYHSGSQMATDAVNKSQELKEMFKAKPREVALGVFCNFLGFVVGSGGIDGNGGIPDLDLQAGIGFHRSILTHSILSGMAVETIAISSIRLTQIIHKNLPNNHDIFWDKAKEHGQFIIENLATGASFGIAYHLFVDATMHGGKAYSDLPFSAPLGVHNAIMGLNSATEAIDRVKKLKNVDYIRI
jgi:hypothetical protein